MCSAKKKEPKIVIKLENCGRFFDDYVVTKNGKDVVIASTAKGIPKELKYLWVQQVRARGKISPDEASVVLHFLSEMLSS